MRRVTDGTEGGGCRGLLSWSSPSTASRLGTLHVTVCPHSWKTAQVASTGWGLWLLVPSALPPQLKSKNCREFPSAHWSDSAALPGCRWDSDRGWGTQQSHYTQRPSGTRTPDAVMSESWHPHTSANLSPTGGGFGRAIRIGSESPGEEPGNVYYCASKQASVQATPRKRELFPKLKKERYCGWPRSSAGAGRHLHQGPACGSRTRWGPPRWLSGL